MFSDNKNDNIIGLLNELKKQLIPILNTNAQLQCVKDRLINKILKVKHPKISGELSSIQDNIWKNATKMYDPNNKVMSISQKCDAAINALQIDISHNKDNGIIDIETIKTLEEELKIERARSAEEKKKLEEALQQERYRSVEDKKKREVDLADSLAKRIADEAKAKEIYAIRETCNKEITALKEKHVNELSTEKRKYDALLSNRQCERPYDTSSRPQQQQQQFGYSHRPM
jgi:hypothetical protein